MNIASLFKKNKDDQKQPTVNTSNQDNVEEDVVPANWIVISEDGEFICSECNNKSAPETNTENGTVTADLNKVKEDLKQYSTKVVYGICPVCGMEFTFKLKDDSLFLEPSEMMK